MNPKDRYEKERLDNKLQRSKEILDVAYEIFIEKGIDKTTMQDVAKEANIGIATLFRYFANKEKLLVAVATETLEPILDHFHYVAELPLTCLEQLEKLFDFFIVDQNNRCINFMMQFELYASYAQDPLEDIQRFNVLNRKISFEYKRIIDNGIKDGSIRSDISIEETLITLINTFGLFSKKLSSKTNIRMLELDLDVNRQLEILKQTFLEYLKA